MSKNKGSRLKGEVTNTSDKQIRTGRLLTGPVLPVDVMEARRDRLAQIMEKMARRQRR